MLTTNINGVVVWNEYEIALRDAFIKNITIALQEICFDINRAWNFKRIECSPLIRQDQISPEYSESDVFMLRDDLALRPETTKGSYDYALKLYNEMGKKCLPICIYQAGLSFRNEQDKTLKNMRLKSFYQLEYQFIYDSESLADYDRHIMSLFIIRLNYILHENLSLENSERTPSYSESTMDILALRGEDALEICSMSKRTDSPIPNTKCFEIAIGLDRLVFLNTLTKVE